ncbi:MAG: hypothetical protein GX083_01965 [Clostridiales bacterium]|nr:hypothetical protein [Clostridiales bacterium]
MEYFIEHLGRTMVAAIIIALIAVTWLYLLEKNSRLKRQRAQARKAAAKKKVESENLTDNEK